MSGKFIAFVGVMGVGKSTLATELATLISAKVFIEPGEECWPIQHNQPWQQQVMPLEMWVRDTNHQYFIQARAAADNGSITVADGALFLINRELIHAASCEWYYKHLSPADKQRLYDIAATDWREASTPDVLVLLEADLQSWQQYLIARGRSLDAEDEFIQLYHAQQQTVAAAAEAFARERGIKLMQFQNEFGAPDENAKQLHALLSVN